MNTPAPLRILLVEDSTTQARFFDQALQTMDPTPSEVAWVDNLAHALERLTDVDLVLLDLTLPDSAGIETFRAVRAAQPDLPIIVLSGTGDEALAQRAVAEGAQDFLFKGSVSPDVLIRSIRYAMERHRTLEEFRRIAIFDELTGVYNRRGFTVLAEQHLDLGCRTGSTIAVLFVDVDGLKQVNDVFGHADGDLLLSDLADLMKATFRSCDVVGRVGGDEFCAMLVNEDNPQAAANRLRQAIDEHNATKLRRFDLSCSIGIVSQQAQSSTLEDLLRRADRAMYDEKHRRQEPSPPDVALISTVPPIDQLAGARISPS
jgi:two-component system cell cycle response regulator